MALALGSATSPVFLKHETVKHCFNNIAGTEGVDRDRVQTTGMVHITDAWATFNTMITHDFSISYLEN